MFDSGDVLATLGLELDAVAMTTASSLGLWHQWWEEVDRCLFIVAANRSWTAFVNICSIFERLSARAVEFSHRSVQQA